MKSKIDPETGFPRVPEGWHWEVHQATVAGWDSKVEYLWLSLHYPDPEKSTGFGMVERRVERFWDTSAEGIKRRHLIREAERLIPLAKDRIKTEFVSPYIGTYPPKKLEK